MKVKVNRETCIGCGVCQTLCPEVFEMDDENVATTKITSVTPDLESDVQSAADSCPVSAIEVEDES